MSLKLWICQELLGSQLLKKHEIDDLRDFIHRILNIPLANINKDL